MANTAAYYTSLLTSIDAKLDAMVANPRPNYRIGTTSYDAGDLMKLLFDMRAKVLTWLTQAQGESFETLNTDVNVFGQDLADYINEETA